MAGLIKEGDIAQVRELNRIEDVIGDYVALRNAGGGSVKGLCPFHDEKSPSFNVRPARGLFHCFGCGEGGDVIAFIQKIEHLGFVEAVQRLADRAGYQITYTGGGTSVQRERGTRSRLIAAHRAAAEFYTEQLASAEAVTARQYLAERGFDEQAARTFGCGYAPGGWDTLTKHLLGRGFTIEELYQAQLAKEGRRGPIDRFHRRLLWPLKDLGGDVVGFGARRLYEDDPIQAKYLNTSESPIYRKSQVLFGIDQAKREIAKRHQAVIVEGYTDVMAMHLAGVTTAVASCGTAFGEEHMSVLRRLLMDDDAFRGEVIFTFDGDAAGQKAALKAFDGDQRFASQTYLAVAPDGMDPCELRQDKGDVAVRDLVARRTPLFEFAVRAILAEHDLDSVDGQVAALKRTVPLVARIKDTAIRDGYAAKLAWWSGWPDEAFVVKRVRETARGGRQSTRKPSEPREETEAATPQGPARPDPADRVLANQREALKLAVQYPEMAGPYYDSLPVDAFTHEAYAELHEGILAAGGAASGLSGAALNETVAANCPHQTVRSLLTELAVEPLHTMDEPDSRYVQSILTALQKRLVGSQIREIKSKLQRMSPLEDQDSYRQLFGDLVALEQWHKSLSEQASGVVL
ncbi:DNA primase [Sciscionella sediminilitoris]|uniref:DNA primase n=1 Tax=Sciscionella sediminilitoris TaxID=1445613 RepID=UPI0004DFCCCB|nr:DNA primase [Sciscionella sp. SE31]